MFINCLFVSVCIVAISFASSIDILVPISGRRAGSVLFEIGGTSERTAYLLERAGCGVSATVNIGCWFGLCDSDL